MDALTITRDGDTARLVASGDWTVGRAAERDADLGQVAAEAKSAKTAEIDVANIERVDTSGAFLLIRTAHELEAAGVEPRFVGLDDTRQVLFDAVGARQVGTAPEPAGREGAVLGRVIAVGAATRHAGRDMADFVEFFGRVASAFAAVVRKPSRLRFPAIVTQMDRAGLQAVPIVLLMSFLIGAIVAQQGAFQLRRFGAEVFVVNLVGILVLREVGLLLAAILFAGRSGSAYTAEIGSMRMREEIDAMRVIGLDPVQVLVLPRLLALILSLPLVTVGANLAGLLGGLVTCWLYLGIEPAVYLQQLRAALTNTHLVVGLIKAPFMALIIGVIACVEGLRVEGSTESLGRHTTASVVKAIFMVIVVDGIFAVVFAAIGW